MYRIKMALKAAIIPSICGLICLVVGIVLFIVGIVADIFALLIVGFFVVGFAIGLFAVAYGQGKQRLNAICPECQKFMGDSDKAVNYSYVCNQYKENHDKDGKFRDYTFYYTCQIECPHCGNTATFEFKINSKTEPKANVSVDNYLKGILKLQK